MLRVRAKFFLEKSRRAQKHITILALLHAMNTQAKPHKKKCCHKIYKKIVHRHKYNTIVFSILKLNFLKPVVEEVVAVVEVFVETRQDGRIV